MKDLTKGSPLKLILLFSLPILAGNILQQFYSLGDSIIVGRILGINSLAAVGATSAIVGLVFDLIYGYACGFSILIANAYGARNEDLVKNLIAKSIILSVILSFVLILIGLLGLRPLMIVLHTPDDIMQESLAYTRIIIFGLIVTMAYSLISNILRALGDSVFPLVALSVSSILNLFLDVLFIKVFHMGIVGASCATVLAQFISVIVCVLYVIKKCPLIHVKAYHFKYDIKMLWDLFTSGSAMALMYSIVCIGSIILQSGINSLGTQIVAAHTAARKIFEFSIRPCSTLSAALVNFTSQNHGAKKPERIKEGLIKATYLAIGWSLGSFLILYPFGGFFIGLITRSEETFIVNTAVKYLRINVPFYFFLAILCFFRSTLQGIGQKIIPILASFIELAGKAVIVFTLVPFMGYMAVCICEPIIWILSGITVSVPIIRFFRNQHKAEL